MTSADPPVAESPDAVVESRSTPANQRPFILLRLTLIIATSYLILARLGSGGFSVAAGALIAIGLASNLALARVPVGWIRSSAFTGSIMLADTIWITAVLIYSGNFGTEFFYLYFFVLLFAAIGENLRLIVLGAAVISSVYLYGILTSEGGFALWDASNLVRIPFLLAVASFYGYLVDRLRRERHRAQQEARSVVRLREAQTVLRQANDELTKLNQMKSDFVATVSHELRTPLASIKNSLDLLGSGRAGELHETQARFVAMAARNAGRLSTIINDILDLSKIEAGKLSFHFEAVDPAALLEELQAVFEPQAASASLSLELDCEPELPKLWADPDRCEQVLTNLLSNAMKFTPAGGRVVLGARAVGEEVELSVRDSGVGIAPIDRERVFEPFYQSGDSLTAKSRGTGLGLSISRNLVEVQGGSLRLESTPGQGSRFFFRLPAHCPRTEELAAFELEIQQHRAFPLFAVLAFELVPQTPPIILDDPRLRRLALERIRELLQAALPRASDVITVQPSCRRLIVVLLGTPHEGSLVVLQKLQQLLTKTEITAEGISIPTPQILGPACYPQDGRTGREITASLYRSPASRPPKPVEAA